MLPALADTQPLCLRVLVFLRHQSRAVLFSFLRKNLVHHSQKILHIRVNWHVHMQGRLFQLFGINIIHYHIRIARPGSKTVTDLAETQTASERQHQITVLDREVARAIADVTAFSDVQRVFVIDTVDAVRAGHNRDSQLFNHAHENIVRRADTDTISGIDYRTFGGADFLDDRTRRLLRHTCRKFCTKFTFSGGILRDLGRALCRPAGSARLIILRIKADQIVCLDHCRLHIQRNIQPGRTRTAVVRQIQGFFHTEADTHRIDHHLTVFCHIGNRFGDIILLIAHRAQVKSRAARCRVITHLSGNDKHRD